MDDAVPMSIVEGQQDLDGETSHDGCGNPMILEPNREARECLAHDFEY